MTMKYTMSLGQKGSASVELRNCSSSPSCDPKNEFYGECKSNIQCKDTLISTLSPPPPPIISLHPCLLLGRILVGANCYFYFGKEGFCCVSRFFAKSSKKDNVVRDNCICRQGRVNQNISKVWQMQSSRHHLPCLAKLEFLLPVCRLFLAFITVVSTGARRDECSTILIS